jgi:hypothetical protein
MTTATQKTTETAGQPAAERDIMKPRGFAAIPCLRCPETGTVSIDLADLTGDEAVYCSSCENRYSLDEVRDVLASWAKVIGWVSCAPEIGEGS